MLCGNTAQQSRIGLFQDSDITGDLEDSKSTSGGVLCIFGSYTFVPMSWIHHIPSNTTNLGSSAMLYVVEDNKDNEAVIQMIIKGRSPTMRHVARTHRVARSGLVVRQESFGPQNSNPLH